jgi:TonB-dependent SusC/RagA subfamily outer membrane receptor
MKKALDLVRRTSFQVLLLLLSITAFSQSKSVTGRVTDSTNTPLANVSVLVKGTTTGTTTNNSGTFSLAVPSSSSVLVFSYTGMQTEEVAVGEQSSISVVLRAKSGTLNEVVVIGYGTARKSDLTGSVATVKSDRLLDKPVANVSQALQGKVPGVDVSINSSAPGEPAKVRIRGISSINSSLDPLYVVDGVIGVDANILNPNDIASLEVLKDASATAIYGARGANGVIIITTKRGLRGKRKYLMMLMFRAAACNGIFQH